MAKYENGGTVVRGADGSLYFIRDEVLQALKIADDGVERIQSVLKENRKAGAAKAGEAAAGTGAVLGYVSGDLLKDQPEGRTVPKLAAKSTYMCPWFCSNTPS